MLYTVIVTRDNRTTAIFYHCDERTRDYHMDMHNGWSDGESATYYEEDEGVYIHEG